VALFGARGACGGCWCMVWRRSRASFEAGKSGSNRRLLHALAKKGPPPGILAYRAGEPVGWCAVAPRTDYVRLAASRVLAPVDDEPVWAISCLFVRKDARRRGMSSKLLRAAAAFARQQGAAIVEGYPVESPLALPDPFVWTGVASAFRAAGFREVERRSATRPIMRRVMRSRTASPPARRDPDSRNTRGRHARSDRRRRRSGQDPGADLRVPSGATGSRSRVP
jgi:GNAT superfamily N-acetyltransferase